MRKIIILIALLFNVGCDFNPQPDPVVMAFRNEKVRLNQQAQAVINDFSKYREAEKAHTESMNGWVSSLDKQQIEALDKLIVLANKGEITELGASSKMQIFLSPEQYQSFAVILNKHNKLVEEAKSLKARAEYCQEKYADFRRRCNITLQISLAQSEANQRYWQQQQQQNQTYRYQQQQIYQLSEINRQLENLWIQQQNQQGGLQILPAPVPYYGW